MPLTPADTTAFRERIQAAITKTVEQERTLLVGISDDLDPLARALIAFLSGGKRLRPAFCYWGWRAAGGDADDAVLEEAAIRTAAGLEFLQACALIHDDVMDGSDTRRGLPAAHHQFANLHRGSMWLGSSEAFGVGAAILLGDLCLSWADQVLFSAGMPTSALLRAKPIYDEMRTELMAGQYLDLLEQARGGGSIERARRVVHFKSAKYTIERPLHLGAALAGADEETMGALSAYGLPLGEAFQLRDDILGVFGDPAVTGKPAGDDLREGKRTVLIAMALDEADPAQQHEMRQRLGDPALDAAGVEILRAIITDTGALAATERMIDELLGQALAAAENPRFDAQARTAFVDLAHASTRRKE